jgi:hypothetical protein
VRKPRQLGEPSAGAKGLENSGQLEVSRPKAKPEGERGGATRNLTGRRHWKRDAEGQPKAAAPEGPKDARFGVTRRSVAGKAGRCRNRGNPGMASTGTTGRQSYEGNFKLERRMC